jgi:hypothetical protein
MLRSLSALACLTILLGLTGWAEAQLPPGTIGVYFDVTGTTQSVNPVQHEDLYMYVILFAEAPIGGAAWRLSMTSAQYPDTLIGPPGPDCQPPECTYQDPPYWYLYSFVEGLVVLGDPWTGVRQGFWECRLGFFGQPVLLATVVLRPWADILEFIEADITVQPDPIEGLVYVDCAAAICYDVTGLTSNVGTTVIASRAESWGSVKALYR